MYWYQFWWIDKKTEIYRWPYICSSRSDESQNKIGPSDPLRGKVEFIDDNDYVYSGDEENLPLKQEFRVPPHFMEPLQEPSIYNEDIVMTDIKEEKPIGVTQKGKKLDKHKFVPLLSVEMYDKTVMEQLGRPLVDEEENQGFVMLGENTRGEYMCLVCGKKTIQVLQKKRNLTFLLFKIFPEGPSHLLILPLFPFKRLVFLAQACFFNQFAAIQVNGFSETSSLAENSLSLAKNSLT